MSDDDSRLQEVLATLDARLDLEAGRPAPVPPPGYQPDARGRLVPDAMVSAEEHEESAAVRRIAAYAVDLADRIARYRRHSHDDIGALLELLRERHGSTRAPGRRGNLSLRSTDGRLRVTVHVQDRIAWGPEIQTARDLVDECIADWREGSRPEVIALLETAFEADSEGRLSLDAVTRLRRLEIDDPRWQQARAALAAGLRVVGTRTYLRVHIRGDCRGDWTAVPISLAAEWTDTATLAAAAEATGGGGIGTIRSARGGQTGEVPSDRTSTDPPAASGRP